MKNLVHYQKIDEIAVITLDNPPVNVLDINLRKALSETIDKYYSDASVKAAILNCAGRTFIAGADISEFNEQPLKEPWLPEIVHKIENSEKPIIAAIHGSALGGGLEIAMGCHFRCATKSAKLGLPEVTLGLLPGATGTQRLPRLAGVKKALDMMISGKPIDAEDALTSGLIDTIIEHDLQKGAIEFAKIVIKKQKPLKRLSKIEIGKTSLEPDLFSEYLNKFKKLPHGNYAQERIIKCVEAAVELPYRDALKVEDKLFLECLNSDQSKALRHLFFAERETSHVPDVTNDTPIREINSVAIIGAGTMGCGIAMAFLNANFPVTLIEINKQVLDKGINYIHSIYDQQVKKGRLSNQRMNELIDNINSSTDYTDINNVDLVIEAVFENMSIKKEVFEKLDKVCKPGAILATNTSTLDINTIANYTDRPKDVIGLHFFAPANIMPLLEIVRGTNTSKDVINTALKMAKTLKKVGVVVGVCFGFVGNRMFLPYIREAELMMLEGVTAEHIDQVACEWGMAMGPHAVTDLSGQDVFFKLNDEWDNQPNNQSYFRICKILYNMGRYGQKTGRGKYIYEGRTSKPDPELTEIARNEAKALGIKQINISNEEIIQRMLYAMINEGALLLEQGIAIRPSDIDVIFCNGYGMPRYRGGPMFYADKVGPKRIYDAIIKYCKRYGEEFWTPAPLLEKLSKEGKTFSQWENERQKN